jgi:large subunit ribosomal protein L10
MALKLNDKKNIVANVAKVAGDAMSVIAADYRGLTVTEMTDLRAKARESGVYLRVIRNTLARRALENTNFSCLQDILEGPLCLAFSMSEPSSAAQLLSKFVKDHENLKVKALSIGGQLLGPDQLEVIAKLPNHKQAIAMLLGILQAVISRFINTLVEPYAKMARAIAAVGQTQGSARTKL